VERFLQTLPAKDRNRITLQNLHTADIPSTQDYNDLMMSRKILDQIPTEMFLVMQTDSLICKGGNTLLNKFMAYDYVGAPWKDRGALGNGGFSLRRKSKMLEILDKCPRNTGDGTPHNEDGFFSGGCEGAMPRKPDLDKAEEFSVETVYKGKQPFGIHKAWDHMPHNSEELDRKCLGYSSLQRMNRN
jgi:hypothetical protein